MINKYVIITLSTLLVSFYLYANKLLHDIDMLKVDLELSKNNELVLTKAIDKQNQDISKYEVDLKTKMEEYTKLVTQPVEVRYETIYKEIPIIKVKSDECKDIKKLLDAIRTTGY